MLPTFCGQSVTVVRPAVAESRGAAVPDWGAATRRELRGCSLQPASTGGSGGSRANATSSSAVLYAPPGADVRAGDRVEAGGATWHVDGVPLARVSPTGRASHVVVRLSEWRG